MHLINCRIRAEPVVVLNALNVPYEHSSSFAEDHWKRVVIVRIVPFFAGRGGMGRKAVKRKIRFLVFLLLLILGWRSTPPKQTDIKKKRGMYEEHSDMADRRTHGLVTVM